MDYGEELKEKIAASLYNNPCGLEELMERNFLKTVSDIGIGRYLASLEDIGWIYDEKGVYRAVEEIINFPGMKKYFSSSDGQRHLLFD